MVTFLTMVNQLPPPADRERSGIEQIVLVLVIEAG